LEIEGDEIDDGNSDGMSQLDLSQRVDWLIEQNIKSKEFNDNLMQQLQFQSNLITNLTQRNQSMDFRDLMGDLRNDKTIQIQKLTNKNFRTWQKEIELIFKENELWELLLGKKKNEGNPNEREFSTKEREKAYRLIYQSCDDGNREVIVNLTDAKSAWDSLLKLYKPDNPMSRLMAMREFFEIKMKPQETMDCFIRRHQQVYRDFVSAGQNQLSDSFLAQHLLLCLPDEYDYVRSIVNTMKLDDLSMQRITEILLAEWKQRSITKSNETIPTSIYFTRKSTNTNGRNKDMGQKQIRCFRCKKLGHLIKDCKMSYIPDNQNQTSVKQVKSYDAAATCLKINHSEPNSLLIQNTKLWIIDTAATCHISFQRSDFFDFTEVSEEVVWGSNSVCKVKGKGKVKASSVIGNRIETFIMNSVLYVPDFRYKIFAIGAATSYRNWVFLSRGNTITALKNGALNFIAVKNKGNNFYTTEFDISHDDLPTNSLEVSNQVMSELEGEKEENRAMTTKTVKGNNNKGNLWHRRLGHICQRKIEEMKTKEIVRGLEHDTVKCDEVECEPCLEMKAVRLRFNKKERQRAEGKLDIIHTDLCGPMRKASAGGAQYVLTFLDDYTRKSDVFLLKQKSEVFEKFKIYKSRVENETGRKIKALRSDNGSEFCNQKLDNFLIENGIKHELTAVYTPQQNGAAERLNRTLVEKTRCLLKDSGLPERFWGEAILTANYIRNHTQTSICKDVVPMELWNGRRPSIGFFRVFGCRAYARVPRPQQCGKFGARATKGIFVGYDQARKAYRIWCQNEERMIHSRDVRFIEDVRGWEEDNEKKKTEPDTNDYAIIHFSDAPVLRELPEIDSNNTDRVTQELAETQEAEDVENIDETEDDEEEDSDDGEESNIGDVEDKQQTPIPTRVEERWRDKRNLRERTPAVKPVKYSMITEHQEKEGIPSVDEVMN
jgi:hypothetical protein